MRLLELFEEYQPVFMAKSDRANWSVIAEFEAAQDLYRVGVYNKGALVSRAIGLKHDAVLAKVVREITTAEHVQGVKFQITTDSLGVQQALNQHGLNNQLAA